MQYIHDRVLVLWPCVFLVTLNRLIMISLLLIGWDRGDREKAMLGVAELG